MPQHSSSNFRTVFLLLGIAAVLLHQIMPSSAIDPSDQQILSWIAGNFTGTVLPPRWNVSTVSAACETWTGIFCDQDGYIERIALDQYISPGVTLREYASTIPAAIGMLPRLYYLGLRRGSFVGTIPSEIFTTVIERIELWGNALSGAIPNSIGNAIRLKYLNLAHNKISSLPIEELRSRLNNSLTDLSLERNSLDCSSFFDELLVTWMVPSRFFACDKSHMMFSPDSEGRICGSSRLTVSSAFSGCPVRPWLSDLRPRIAPTFFIRSQLLEMKIQGSRITFYSRKEDGTVSDQNWVAWDFYGISVYSGNFLEDEATFDHFDEVVALSESSYMITATMQQSRTTVPVEFKIFVDTNITQNEPAVSLNIRFDGLTMPTTARRSALREFGLPMQILFKAPITDDSIDCRIYDYTSSLLSGNSTGCQSKISRLTWDPNPTGAVLRFRSEAANFTIETPLLFKQLSDPIALPLESKDPQFYIIPDGDVRNYTSGGSMVASSSTEQALAFLFQLNGEFVQNFTWSPAVQLDRLFTITPPDNPPQRAPITLPIFVVNQPRVVQTTTEEGTVSRNQGSGLSSGVLIGLAAGGGTILFAIVVVTTVRPIRRRVFRCGSLKTELIESSDDELPRTTTSMSTVPLTSDIESASRASSLISLSIPTPKSDDGSMRSPSMVPLTSDMDSSRSSSSISSVVSLDPPSRSSSIASVADQDASSRTSSLQPLTGGIDTPPDSPVAPPAKKTGTISLLRTIAAAKKARKPMPDFKEEPKQ